MKKSSFGHISLHFDLKHFILRSLLKYRFSIFPQISTFEEVDSVLLYQRKRRYFETTLKNRFFGHKRMILKNHFLPITRLESTFQKALYSEITFKISFLPIFTKISTFEEVDSVLLYQRKRRYFETTFKNRFFGHKIMI